MSTNLEYSGYKCRRCSQKIPKGHVFVFRVEKKEDLPTNVICSSCRLQMRETARQTRQPLPNLFPINDMLKFLEEKERRWKEAWQKIQEAATGKPQNSEE